MAFQRCIQQTSTTNVSLLEPCGGDEISVHRQLCMAQKSWNCQTVRLGTQASTTLTPHPTLHRYRTIVCGILLRPHHAKVGLLSSHLPNKLTNQINPIKSLGFFRGVGVLSPRSGSVAAVLLCCWTCEPLPETHLTPYLPCCAVVRRS